MASPAQPISTNTDTSMRRNRKSLKCRPNPVDWSALDWEDMGIDWSSAWAKGQASKTAAAAAAAQSTTAPASSVASVTSVTHGVVAAATSVTSSATAAASSSESLVDAIEDLFDSLVGCSNARKAFGEIVSAAGSLGDNYRGNYGSPYGSNVIKVSSKSSYSYTAEFHNTQSKSITINIWNKVGPDLRDLSGSALAPKNTTLTFVLAAGASQIVAFDENSQVAWAEACSSTAASGAYATTWDWFWIRHVGHHER
ncbi:allergen asp f 4 protein [Rutstroemia sp. NJR-2017a BVV2]|nr:allergen asp f 4 protein [Rutstroemia sp. NJR-2017a BVV2]